MKQTKETKLQKLAGETLKQFVRRTRVDGKKFWCLSDSFPGGWISDMIHAAHCDAIPDDYKYKFIVESLGMIAESADPEGIDMEADIYNAALTDWLGSANYRPGYVDEAIDELGHTDTIIGDIQQGQIREQQEVFEIVLEALRSR